MHEEKSQGGGLESRKTRFKATGSERPEGRQPRQVGENGVGTLAPTTARCEVGLLGLLRDRSRRSWVVPSVPNPEQVRNGEIKLGKKKNDPLERNRRKRELCTVGRPSDRDHLVTREGEGCEEPFERDGTTRRSRGENRHVVEVRCAPG
ncbi:hypothetical protein CDL15_Pgr028284 [Punica granatum]|uniref:Uncharacterized protein n=1 Tax=Punica granatum TaxID=22663 RepID=A0A218X1E6_PUNGR|nr:hypothetical protein CDL15_Pgr028284 [Punica granatum]